MLLYFFCFLNYSIKNNLNQDKFCIWLNFCFFGLQFSDSHPCYNNATCRQSSDSPYACHCTDGFLGPRCEQVLDMCQAPGPCSNGATCIQNVNTYKCQCPPTWTGHLCDVMMVNCSVAASLKGYLFYLFIFCQIFYLFFCSNV